MEFIIESEPKNLKNYDGMLIVKIENKIKDNKEVTMEEVEFFLDYLSYIVRKRLDGNFKNATYKNFCNTAQCMIHYYLEELGVEHYLNRSFNSIDEKVIDHSFVCAIFNTENGEIPFIIDPTYRQFFEKERCKKNPFTPGNFIRSEDISTISEFLKRGHMLMTINHAKVYGNSIYFTKKNLVERERGLDGNTYFKIFLKNSVKPNKSVEDLKKHNYYIYPKIRKQKSI